VSEEFIEYLRRIGMSEPLIERVGQFFTWCSDLAPEEIEEIFVDDYLQTDGTRLYGGIWFFTRRYTMETGIFVDDQSFDFVPLRVLRWDVSFSNYDFGEANDQSRMSLRIDVAQGITGSMRATRENCEKLTAILRERVIPSVYAE
jgi:hypothetical protein